jgi:hypothetical protein
VASSDTVSAEGYHFRLIRNSDDHLNLILSRTVILRTLAMLRRLGSVGIFYNRETYTTLEEADEDAQDPSISSLRSSDSRTVREIELSVNAVDASSVAERLEKVNRQSVA